LRDVSITFAPAAAIDAAIALPIPRDAPVTSATFPSNEICMPPNIVRKVCRPSRWMVHHPR
jgi:hypothetical protein